MEHAECTYTYMNAQADKACTIACGLKWGALFITILTAGYD